MQDSDYPLLVIYAPFGDDVCNMHVEDTLAHMTTPEQFQINVIDALNYLDEILPPGSHVVFIGIVDGSILWYGLHNRSTPLGNGITYRDVYEWLLCLNTNPCVGWLNPNETLRNLTTDKGNELSNVYAEIVANYTFKNFDMIYYPSPVIEITQQFIFSGGDPTLLIEPVDGFHPSQIMNALYGQWLYTTLLNDHPEFLGTINPNNPIITELFGNQGGY